MAVHEGISGLAQDGIYLSGSLYAKPITCLVDTGANISIIQAGIFFTVPARERPQLELKGLSMVLADGKSVPILGKAEMVVTIGDKGLSHEFWVADIGPDCILGLDFLRRHNCVINARMGRVMLGSEQPMHGPSGAGKEDFSSRIISAETFVLPANSEMIVEARMKNFQEEYDGEVRIIQPSVELLEKKSVLVARCLLRLGAGNLPVRLANFSDQAVTVYKDTTFGVCEGVEEVISSRSGEGDIAKDPRTGPVLAPGHQEELYQDSTRGLRVAAGEGVGEVISSKYGEGNIVEDPEAGPDVAPEHQTELHQDSTGNLRVVTCEEEGGTRSSGSDKARITEEQDWGQTVPKHLQELYQDCTKDLEEEQKLEVVRLLSRRESVFAKGPEDLGRTNVDRHRIDTGGHPPIKQPARRLPFHKQEEATQEINNMLSAGVIEPSCSPWSSPIVLVRKKDGSLRFCIDFRKVNEVTVKDSYPLPRIDDTLDMLGGATWFSTLDLASGYWQIEVEAADRDKTAFSTHQGLFQFKVMPFGLCNAPATFERLMDKVLGGLKWESCLVYLDDVIVYGKTFPEHIGRLEDVIKRLGEAGLKLSPKKCQLFKHEVTFLGHVVSSEGIHTDPEKIRAVTSWTRPTNVRDVRGFVGLCSYYRRFIEGFSTIAKPLHRLTEKGREFRWTEECENAFCELKRRLTTAPILSYPTREGPFVLDTDASEQGVGAVLSQIQNGEERVIGYYSRTMTKPERRYCVTRKELLAIVAGVKWFHHFLYGRRFLIRTDHGALTWLMKFRQPEGQTARWLERLGNYDFTIQHRAGRVHNNADALSRRPCKDCSYCEREESKEYSNKEKQCRSTHVAEAESQKVVCVGVTLQPEDTPHESDTKMIPKTPSWTSEELIAHQEDDPDLLPIRQGKAVQEKPPWESVSGGSKVLRHYWSQWDSLVLKDGLLLRRFESPKGDEVRLQFVVPAALQKQVWEVAHSHPLSGHFMTKKTLHRLREKFYWSGASRDVDRWCRSCEECGQRRGHKSKARGKLRLYRAGEPLQRMALDIMGPLPTTTGGNRYVLVMADYFSKWVETAALPDQGAVTVAKALVEKVICRFGIPEELHSDQGRQFESAVFQKTCELLNVKKTRTTPYHPQSDGMVERFNRTLETMLSLVVSPNQKDWDVWLPMVTMAYNTAIHESTGYSPAELMFGRQLRTPMDLLLPTEDQGGPDSYPEYVENLRQRLREVHKIARINLQKAGERQKTQADRRAYETVYSPGDLVMLHCPAVGKGKTSKLNRPWAGPVVVLKRLNDILYRVKLGPHKTPKLVHHNRLKKFEGETPDWVKGVLLISEEPKEVGWSLQNGSALAEPEPQKATSTKEDLENNSKKEANRGRQKNEENNFTPDPKASPVVEGDIGVRRSQRRRKPPDRLGL